MPSEPSSHDRPAGADATAARAATIMAYVVAVVGAFGATLSLREGEVVAAVVVLTTTLGVAALLSATGTLLRTLRAVERRLRALEHRLHEGGPDSAAR
jgi:DNA-binding PucR family transcriptional regulator